MDFVNNEWLNKRTYELKYSTSTDSDGNQVIDNIELIEKNQHINLDANIEVVHHYGFDSALALPTANEIRPVNKAVKFMIKAKKTKSVPYFQYFTYNGKMYKDW